MSLESQIVALIKELRNKRDLEKNWATFQELVEKPSNLSWIVENLSTRWLISIVDTYIDCSTPIQSARAMNLSILMNLLRLGETVKAVRPQIDQEAWENASNAVIWLDNGLNTFAIQKQDLFLNLSKRLHKVLEDDSILYAFLIEFLKRLEKTENIITDFSKQSQVKERYFPVDPTGLKDNYGL